MQFRIFILAIKGINHAKKARFGGFFFAWNIKKL